MKHQEEVRNIIGSYLQTGVGSIRGPLMIEEVDRELAELGKRLSDGKEQAIVGGRDWDRMKAQLRQGGELYFCRSDPESWNDFHGWEGYLAIRGSTVIDAFPTAMN
jgi:hypothetical protein